MLPDYIFIFLALLIILLFYLAMKYFKFLFFYLGVLLGILLGTYGKIFLDDKNFNLGFINVILDSIKNFFSDSLIVGFLGENLNYLFILFIIALFHRFFYYLALILFHFFKWLFVSIFNWLSHNKTIKHNQSSGNNENIINIEKNSKN